MIADDFEHLNVARQRLLDPGVEVQVRLRLLRLTTIIIPGQVGVRLDLAADERQMAADGDETVHEPVEVLGGREPRLGTDEAQGGHALPEVPPPAGEHGRLHGLIRRQQGEHVLEQRVGEVADAVHAARCGRLLVHSVEHVAGVQRLCGSGEWKDEQRRRRRRKCVESRITSRPQLDAVLGCPLLRLPALGVGGGETTPHGQTFVDSYTRARKWGDSLLFYTTTEYRLGR